MACLGFPGLTSYWFIIEAFAYVEPAGRNAANAKADYNIGLTQRALISPKLEAIVYGKSDQDRRDGSALSDIETGLQFRYEFQREVAPYIGVTWERQPILHKRPAIREQSANSLLAFISGFSVERYR